MVGIHGIGGVPEPRPDRPAEVRDRKGRDETLSVKAEDDVMISSEAQAAASLARLIQEAKTTPDVRADKVAAAKESIERGDYKQADVVAQVAARISKYL
jgi:anti-sigma28 factor (negative regulator of flagellin synthesis)